MRKLFLAFIASLSLAIAACAPDAEQQLPPIDPQPPAQPGDPGGQPGGQPGGDPAQPGAGDDGMGGDDTQSAP